MPKLEVQSKWLYPKTGEKTVRQRPIQTLIRFEITTANHELNNSKPVNDSKRKMKRIY